MVFLTTSSPQVASLEFGNRDAIRRHCDFTRPRATTKMTSLSTLPAQLLGATLYYSGFSRFTHGAYTPWWFAHQTARQPDDGSIVARIVPCMDVALATALAFGGKTATRSAAIFAAVTQGGAIVALITKGRRDLAVDFAVFALAVAAAAGTWSRHDARPKGSR